VALCLGFAIQDNFKFPYAAIGFSDFWRRWHISLSSWLRDYLYISLGGNRQGPGRTQVNLMITMLLGGLWHGASWTFVAWGGLHGLYLVLERWCQRLFGAWGIWQQWPARIALGLLTYVAVVITWVFFRAQDFTAAGYMLGHMFALPLGPTWKAVKGNEVAMVLGITVVMLAIHGLLRNRSVEWVADRTPWWVRSLVLGGMLVAIATMAGDDRAFIYFQF
jgi:D-alanyl-lipoteichoic acid acyltransferase DltB (MBOAT superfamily)